MSYVAEGSIAVLCDRDFHRTAKLGAVLIGRFQREQKRVNYAALGRSLNEFLMSCGN